MDAGTKNLVNDKTEEIKTEPIHVLSVGAGVQSSTMALMASHGEIKPMPTGGIFADTKAEPQSVYRWLKYLRGKLAFKITIVTKGSLTKAALAIHTSAKGLKYYVMSIPYFTFNHKTGEKGKISSRGCTQDFKIKPIIAELRRMVGSERMKAWRKKHASALKELSEWKKQCKEARKNKTNQPFRPHRAWMECQQDPLVVQWIGISLDEVNRMKESRDPWIQNRWSLVEMRMRRHDCLLWMKKNGYQKPPRSACVYCPFHDDPEWRRLKDDEPAEFQKAVKFDRAIRRNRGAMISESFLHRSLKPLDQVDFSTEQEKGQGELFQNECEGMCGV